jgi:hypothetical protein
MRGQMLAKPVKILTARRIEIPSVQAAPAPAAPAPAAPAS